ncbi:peroxide stress protein YaaA [Streptomyces sp. SID8379]|uniref:peroxide stress protein YaaA n=1 Tax=unclassified Streptomyces TaxID=2593676 RepID=UPI0003A17E7A|nr:peroxide stress protein YaaA [Streptomyces sp. HmicA12]MYW64557.1 peroxide stress protein YaaA [Streptomyces sp. SID8379]
MLVLLPPSEGKAASGRGAPLKPEGLSLPGLTGARTAVLDELVELCASDEEKAREVLGLSEGLRGEVAKNTELRTAGARPAGEIYTGVLYDALDLASLDAAAKKRAARSLLVFSGLWGAVRVTDRIPSYRCSMGVKLPGLGALGTYWKAPMAEVMPEAAGDGLVLDLRSAAYAAAWKPKASDGGIAERTAGVRVLHAPTRKVVSHFNKATKGRIVRSLLTSGITPAGPAELVDVLRELGYVVEVEAPTRAGRAWNLDVLVDEIH